MVARIHLPPPVKGRPHSLCKTCVFGFRASVGRSEHLPWHHRKGFEATAPLVALQRSQSPADAQHVNGSGVLTVSTEDFLETKRGI